MGDAVTAAVAVYLLAGLVLGTLGSLSPKAREDFAGAARSGKR